MFAAFTYELAVILAMLVVNGVFAAYEMALASIPHARLVVLVQQRKVGATAALYMKERMEASLAVVQLGITLAGAIAAATGGAALGEFLEPWLRTAFGLSDRASEAWAITLFVIPLSAVTIIFAELVPKTFALEKKEAVCLALSPAMRVIARFAAPLVDLFESAVKRMISLILGRWKKRGPEEEKALIHELSAAATLARTARLIGAREEKIVLAAAQLSVRPVKQIVIPAADISMLPVDLSLPEALIRAHMDLHTRFPACATDGDPQTIQGYVTFKDIVVTIKMSPGTTSLRGIVRPIKRIGESLPIAEVLEQMMREKLHIALVETSGHQILGMITLEDIIEELVGDIDTEEERLPAHIHSTENGWIMGGGVSMEKVSSLTSVKWLDWSEGQRIPTLAQWCEQVLGRLPKKAEVIERDRLKVVVRKLRRRRLAEAFVTTLS